MALLAAATIVGVLSACASDSDGGATTASSPAVETAATAVAPLETETAPSTAAPTTAPPATTEPEADEPPVATTTAEATTTTTSDLSPSPPEAGKPNTVNIVFEDGETGTAPVSCDSDPELDFFEFSFTPSDPDERPSFDLLFFNTGEKVSNWQTEDEIWLVSPSEGSIDVIGDLSQSPISGTGVFLEADLSEEGEIQWTTPSGGQPLTTGEERAAAFTIVCAHFSGDGQPLTTGG